MTIQHAPSDCWKRHLKGLAIRFSNLSSHSNYWCSYRWYFRFVSFSIEFSVSHSPKIIHLAEQTTALDFQISAKEGQSSYRQAAL